jgi:hypothetical protein
MASQSERLPLDVTVGSPETFQEELEAAVAIAQADAVQKGQCGSSSPGTAIRTYRRHE